MKRIIFIIAILFAGISVQAQTQTYYWGDANHDGKIDIEDITILTDIILGKREAETFQIETKHDYVDLGLSVKWATCNVGATSPEEFGDYFAWGETKTKTTYASDWSGYFDTVDGGTSFVKYNNNGGETVLLKEDDAASVIWGGYWRMPKYSDWVELRNNCTWTETTQNGVYGYKVASKMEGYTDNYIFLPAAGYHLDAKFYDDSYGYYWSSSIYLSSTARNEYIGYKSVYDDCTDRNYGYSIRPVCP